MFTLWFSPQDTNTLKFTVINSRPRSLLMTSKLPLFLSVQCTLSPNKLKSLMWTVIWCIAPHSNSLSFAWIFLITYHRTKLKSKGLSSDMSTQKSTHISGWKSNLKPLTKVSCCTLKQHSPSIKQLKHSHPRKKRTAVLVQVTCMNSRHYNPPDSPVKARFSLVTSICACIGKVQSSHLGLMVRSLDPSFICKLANTRLVS
jgi:hypothetical protein